jgi:filamentous hemagglutinin family protein
MAQQQQWQSDRPWLAGVISIALAAGCPGMAIAQSITTDGSLSPAATLTGPNYTIPQTSGRTAGSNLFHSFGRFGLILGESVTFQSAANIRNILARVTGGFPSAIDGLITIPNTNTNLFLINPSGIIFGPNARLDVRGSVIASTANSINFADGTQFSATPASGAPLLTVSIPIGLQFGPNPAPIRVQGDGQGLRETSDPPIDTQVALRVPGDRTLALVGGAINLEGATLKTDGGRIELGSVTSPGVVQLTAINKGFALGYATIISFGNIQLSRATSVDASGNRGGDIQLQGRQIIIQGGSQVETSTLRQGTGGTLTVTATELVKLSGSTADNAGDNRRNPSSLSSDNRDAGIIPSVVTINTGQLLVERGARISASNTRSGLGGNITINAADQVEFNGTGFSTGGQRSSGASVQNRGSGNAGRLTINSRRFILRDGAEASASTFESGDGGSVVVNASDSVELTGTSANGQLRSRLVAGVGNPAEVLSNTMPTPSTNTTGRGGNLTITTGKLSIEDGAIAAVSSRSTARNAQGAGTLTVNAQSIFLHNQGAIAAETFSGQGGNITLNVQDLILLRRNSQISTTAGTAQAGGNGGNITINAPNGFVVGVLRENSDIRANAFTGRGGRVDITAQGIYGLQFQRQNTPFSDITASSQFGISGVVNLNVLNIDPSRGLVELPINLTDPAQQIAQGCNPGGKTAAGQFTATGRGGIPLSPNEALESRAVVTKWVPLPTVATDVKADETHRATMATDVKADEPDRATNLSVSSVPKSAAPSVPKSAAPSVPKSAAPSVPKSAAPSVPKSAAPSVPKSAAPSAAPIVEAQGWIIHPDGIVELVANVATSNLTNFGVGACPTAQGMNP